MSTCYAQLKRVPFFVNLGFERCWRRGEMTGPVHPNLALLKKLNLHDLDAYTNVFSDDFTWHHFNSRFWELEGRYRGVEKVLRNTE